MDARARPSSPRFVAGAIGPTNQHALDLARRERSVVPRSVDFDELRDAYAEQVRGADRRRRPPAPDRDDLRHAERQGRDRRGRSEVFDERGVELPLMISVTITDRSGRTLSGQTIDAFWTSIAHARPLSVGINCALGAQRDAPVPGRARGDRADPGSAATRTRACPNAFGGYDETPEQTARAAARVRRERAREPASAAAAAPPTRTSARSPRRWRASPPRVPPRADPRRSPRFSGLEPLRDPPRLELH